nr:MAG TPA: DNA repair protein MmcB-like protein [Caudoviricetes sp.]
MKTQRTKDLEKLLANKFNDRNDFYVFECTLGWYGSEIVDCVMYNCQREVNCYEIKQSVADFHSKNKLSFFGNKNYFVMPYSLYEKVKNEIPYGIGVYVAIDRLERKEELMTNMYDVTNKKIYVEPIDGMKELYCIKSAKKQDLKADKEVILSSMLRSMQRDRILNIGGKE